MLGMLVDHALRQASCREVSYFKSGESRLAGFYLSERLVVLSGCGHAHRNLPKYCVARLACMRH